MKTDVRRTIVQIEPDVLNELVKEVKETLATDLSISVSNPQQLTAADLWNIRRNAVTAQSRFNR